MDIGRGRAVSQNQAISDNFKIVETAFKEIKTYYYSKISGNGTLLETFLQRSLFLFTK